MQKSIEEGTGKDDAIQPLKEEYQKNEGELRTLLRVELRKEKKKYKEDIDILVNLFKKEASDLSRKNQEL